MSASAQSERDVLHIKAHQWVVNSFCPNTYCKHSVAAQTNGFGEIGSIWLRRNSSLCELLSWEPNQGLNTQEIPGKSSLSPVALQRASSRVLNFQLSLWDRIMPQSNLKTEEVKISNFSSSTVDSFLHHDLPSRFSKQTCDFSSCLGRCPAWCTWKQPGCLRADVQWFRKPGVLQEFSSRSLKTTKYFTFFFLHNLRMAKSEVNTTALLYHWLAIASLWKDVLKQSAVLEGGFFCTASSKDVLI